jgi:hypothetical protein
MTIQIVEKASRRKQNRIVASREGLHVPAISEPAIDLTLLSRGGREIYRRTHRPTSTCNMLATLAGIGVEREAR